MYIEKRMLDRWELLDPRRLCVLTAEDVIAKSQTSASWTEELWFDHKSYTQDFCALLGMGNDQDRLVSLKGCPDDLSAGLLKVMELEALPYETISGTIATPPAESYRPVSWLTAEEVLALDWDRDVTVERMVDAKQAKFFTEPPSRFPIEAMTQTGQDGGSSVTFGAKYWENGVSVRYLLRLRDHYSEFLLAVDKLKKDLSPFPVRLVYLWN